MSEFGRTFFAGSTFLRWTVGPLAVLSALAFAVLQSDWQGSRAITFVAVEVALVLLGLVAFAPHRFHWAGRALAGIVFLAYVAYLVDMALTEPSSFWPPSRRSAATGFNSLLGLLGIGYPSLKYAMHGRFSWRKPPEAMKLEDLPHFTATAIERLEGRAVLRGHFSRPDLVHGGDCWLRMPDDPPFYATVTAFDPATALATLESRGDLPAKLTRGVTLPWFDEFCSPNDVNTILDREHPWTAAVFQAVDAFERSGPDSTLGIQCVATDGRAWRKANDSPLPGDRRVKGGWDHEHCLICFATIGPGDDALVDSDDQWLCTTCHANHAVPGDLSFLFLDRQRPDT